MKEGIYERVLKFSSTHVPIGLAGLGLVAITIYRLVTPISDDLKKKLSYAELALSFVTSSMILLYMGALFMSILMLMFRSLSSGIAPNMFGFYMGMSFIFYSLVGLLINPFALTVMRLTLQDKINDTVVSGGIVASTGLILSYVWAALVVTRR